ncbi:MmyB family transcriptional regulator [Sphingomonas hankookensis]
MAAVEQFGNDVRTDEAGRAGQEYPHEPEREHLYMLGLGITPRLQRVLDGMVLSPAIIKTAMWDVVGWNRAATVLLTDYSKLPREDRNVLPLMFGSNYVRSRNEDWESIARFVVGAFRADVARANAGTSAEVTRLVADLSAVSPEFIALPKLADARPSTTLGTRRCDRSVRGRARRRRRARPPSVLRHHQSDRATGAADRPGPVFRPWG